MVVVVRVVYRHPALRSRKVRCHQGTVAFLLRTHRKRALAVYSQLQFMVRLGSIQKLRIFFSFLLCPMQFIVRPQHI